MGGFRRYNIDNGKIREIKIQYISDETIGKIEQEKRNNTKAKKRNIFRAI